MSCDIFGVDVAGPLIVKLLLNIMLDTLLLNELFGDPPVAVIGLTLGPLELKPGDVAVPAGSAGVVSFL